MSLKLSESSFLSGNEYTYIWISLPNEGFQEMLDAKKLGNNLYQILQIPFMAENLNQYDIVECKDIDKVKHDFMQVIKFSGYRTFHIEFSDNTNQDDWLAKMKEIESIGADWRNSGKYFSISVPPTVELLELLQKWEQEKTLIIDAVNYNGSQSSDFTAIDPFE